MKRHELKIWNAYFEAVAARKKKFEIRKNDRDFREGDHLILREWDPSTQQYTGRSAVAIVTFMLEGGDYLQAGFCCMSINLVSTFRQNQTDLAGMYSEGEALGV